MQACLVAMLLTATSGSWDVYGNEVVQLCSFGVYPDHDWTVEVGERYYGLMQFGSSTHVALGPWSFDVQCPAWAVAAIFVGTPLLLLLIGTIGMRRHARREPLGL